MSGSEKRIVCFLSVVLAGGRQEMFFYKKGALSVALSYA